MRIVAALVLVCMGLALSGCGHAGREPVTTPPAQPAAAQPAPGSTFKEVYDAQPGTAAEKDKATIEWCFKNACAWG